MWKFPRRRSPIPDEPEPTPRKTKLSAKTSARKMNTGFVERRSRMKNIVCSATGGLRAARGVGWAFAGRGRCFAAPRAMRALGYRPLERVAHGTEASLDLLGGERAGDPCIEGGAWVEPEASRGLVVAGQVGVEHGRVVRRDGAEHACLDELRQRMLLERGH